MKKKSSCVSKCLLSGKALYNLMEAIIMEMVATNNIHKDNGTYIVGYSVHQNFFSITIEEFLPK